jgi:pSer/pThr/pTyr-binding forkhead associated (FHA) protein
MDLFLQACGASAPLQLRIECSGSALVECRVFDTPYVVIGRDPQSDLVLEHKEVCPRHAYLQWIGGRLYCVDLGSRSGIVLGGTVRRAGWLEPQQSVRIGPYRIRLGADDGVAPGPAAPAFETPPVTLDLSHRGFKASECVLNAGLSLVGSSTDCQVRLIDPDVSNMHCSLIATHLGVWAVDLFGKTGIQVNGTPVRHALLEPGDELRVGRSSIRVRQTRECRVSAPEPDPESESLYGPAFTSYLFEQPAHEPVLDHVAPPPPHFEIRGGPVLVDDLEARQDPFPVYDDADRDPDPAMEPETESSSSLMSSIRRRQIEEQRYAALSAQERRASCRYPVAEVEAVLTWWEPAASATVVRPAPKGEPKLSPAEESIYGRVMARWPGNHTGKTTADAIAELARDPLPAVEESLQSRVSSARLVDISQTGALVLSEAVPPPGGRIWLRLETPQITDWVEVVLKGSTPEAPGTHRVRLAFREACPYDIFKLVVYKKPGS